MRLLGRLPLRWRYWCADAFLYPLLRYVIGYRRKVVRHNLRNAYPDADEAWLTSTEKNFYHFFADLLVEIPYFRSMSEQEAFERVEVVNWEEVDYMAQQYGACILMTSHYGNWEWLTFLGNYSRLPESRFYNVYRRLSNTYFNGLMAKIRSAHGSVNVEKQMLLRHMVNARKEGIPGFYGMIADQSPSRQNIHYWTELLHQPTAVLTGSETLARKFHYPVFYADVQRVKRGYYRCELTLLCEHPEQEELNAITETYARRLEQTINRAPELWLWTHNRWKHKP